MANFIEIEDMNGDEFSIKTQYSEIENHLGLK